MLSLQTWINYLEINSKYQNECDKKKIIQFVFLWMKYNEYYNMQNPTMRKDSKKALKILENQTIQNKYSRLKNRFISKFNQIHFDSGAINRQYLINRDGIQTPYNQNDGSLEDFLKIVYQIRCNFFHGNKEPIRVDIELIGWAFDCLNELLDGII